MTFVLYGLKYTFCHIYCSVLFLLCFYDEVTYYQRLELFFDLQANLHLVALKNDLRIIVDPKIKNFKNIEARQSLDILISKNC